MIRRIPIRQRADLPDGQWSLVIGETDVPGARPIIVISTRVAAGSRLDRRLTRMAMRAWYGPRIPALVLVPAAGVGAVRWAAGQARRLGSAGARHHMYQLRWHVAVGATAIALTVGGVVVPFDPPAGSSGDTQRPASPHPPAASGPLGARPRQRPSPRPRRHPVKPRWQRPSGLDRVVSIRAVVVPPGVARALPVRVSSVRVPRLPDPLPSRPIRVAPAVPVAPVAPPASVRPVVSVAVSPLLSASLGGEQHHLVVRARAGRLAWVRVCP